ncbi:hypothetical protein OAJ57_01225 [Alphaproteobacteria bacterium]|nr:hypothetical protein [Alphaproteobacteria bacterium]
MCSGIDTGNLGLHRMMDCLFDDAKIDLNVDQDKITGQFIAVIGLDERSFRRPLGRFKGLPAETHSYGWLLRPAVALPIINNHADYIHCTSLSAPKFELTNEQVLAGHAFK